MAIVINGDRILVVDKRLFKDDNTRLFVGIVEEFANDVIRARGFSFHVSPYEVSGAERRGEERVRIITLSAGDIVFRAAARAGPDAPSAEALAQIDAAFRRGVRDGPQRLHAAGLAARTTAGSDSFLFHELGDFRPRRLGIIQRHMMECARDFLVDRALAPCDSSAAQVLPLTSVLSAPRRISVGSLQSA